MLAVVPWDALVARIAPFAPAGTTGRPPYPVLVLLRVHFLQQWFSLADEAVEEVLHDIPVYLLSLTTLLTGKRGGRWG